MQGTTFMSKVDLAAQNAVFETQSPQEILRWGWSTFGPDIALLSSFGTESSVLLHMISEVAPETKVLFLETGYHFPETLQYQKDLVKSLKLNLVELKAEMGREAFVKTYGDKLYETNPDRCCEINKVQPLQRALKDYKAWISGIRRGQGPTRKNIHILEEYDNGGHLLYKLNPLANWTSKDAWQYMKEHHLPVHPLFEKGYTSIGCWPCTRPVLPGEDDRAGRWAGRVKTECGIHTFMKPKENNEEKKTQ